jgi:hypothetical protein
MCRVYWNHGLVGWLVAFVVLARVLLLGGLWGFRRPPPLPPLGGWLLGAGCGVVCYAGFSLSDCRWDYEIGTGTGKIGFLKKGKVFYGTY